MVRELHSGGLGGHFGIDKTIALVKEKYFWPSINKDVRIYVSCCRKCQLAKGRSQNTTLHIPFLISERVWEDVIMDIVLGLPIT